LRAGQKYRKFFADSHPTIVDTIQRYEKPIPEKHWFDIPLEDFYYWDNSFSLARVELVNLGNYDARMLKLLKKIRCQSYADRAECLPMGATVYQVRKTKWVGSLLRKR